MKKLVQGPMNARHVKVKTKIKPDGAKLRWITTLSISEAKKAHKQLERFIQAHKKVA